MQGLVADAPTRFTRAAWAALAYTVLVILFGAVVRITGSGSGCGQHWPTCHGEVIPLSPTIETLIEFSHRVTSGLCGFVVIALLVMAIRGFPRGHAARVGAWLALFFTITEALIGAGLVRFGLVGHNDSVARAIVMAAHLVNTSLLTGALALAAWAGGRDRLAAAPARPPSRTTLLVLASLGGLMLVGLSGAVTALGDTLYPVESGALAERLQRDLGAGAHFLQRLRLMHPLLACGLGFFTGVVAYGLSSARAASPEVRLWGSRVVVLTVVQLVAGVVNVMLSAPGWMQVVHLLLGTTLWIAAVVFALHVVRPAAPSVRR
jgi:cytochrome c oxidase assembly protein subunit 15